MVLLNSEVHRGKNWQKWIYSLAVIVAYTTITVFFFSSIYNYNINHYPKEKDSDFQVSV